jgi:hypothetical protein
MESPSRVSSEFVFRGDDVGSAREWMEQKILLVENVIDPGIER